MSADPARGACLEEALQERPLSDGSNEWANEESGKGSARGEEGLRVSKERLSRLARALETDVIPRLVQAHRPQAGRPRAANAPSDAAVVPTQADVDELVRLTQGDSEAPVDAAVARLREAGVSVEALYLDLFSPVARHLGWMWEEDLCDFSVVTVALGRLQRLLRELSPAFGNEVEHPALGRRALFVQPRGEQHSFGLSMVAEFFRRDGWDVIGGVGGAVTDPAGKVRSEWVDIIGFSIGTDFSLPWLTETVRCIRAASLNPGIVVLVGGPPFMRQPELAAGTGADGTARDARDAPLLAERVLMERIRHKSPVLRAIGG